MFSLINKIKIFFCDKAKTSKVYFLCLGVGALALFSVYSEIFASTDNPLNDSASIRGAITVQNAMRQIYKEVNPAVVRIETESNIEIVPSNDPIFRFFFNIPRGRQRGRQHQRRKQQGLGSGFILDSKKGYIITNHHVVAKRSSKKYVDKVKVKLVNGKSYDAKVIGSDIGSDIALLQIKSEQKLKQIYIGDSDTIEVGDFAIAIGNPFGLSSTFTMGVISSKGQDVESRDGVPRIQTDAPINPGNSGGPLLSIKGEVIGINQMIYTQGMGGGSIGIGFAIPINYAMSVIEKLKSGKKVQHGFIGVQIIPSPTPDQLQELNIKNKAGLLVANVTLGSPAWKAGVRPYDFITHIDGKVAEKFSDLKSVVIRKGVGTKMTVKILRNGLRKNFKIKIGEAKS